MEATQQEEKTTEVTFVLDNGKEQSVNLTLPIQMLFDDVVQFVSTL